MTSVGATGEATSGDRGLRFPEVVLPAAVTRGRPWRGWQCPCVGTARPWEGTASEPSRARLSLLLVSWSGGQERKPKPSGAWVSNVLHLPLTAKVPFPRPRGVPLPPLLPAARARERCAVPARQEGKPDAL